MSYSPVPLNTDGRVKTSNLPAPASQVTGSITANGQTVYADVSRYSNVMLHCYGTFSTINVTFEGSINSTNGTDGNWFTIQAVRSNANTVETATGNLSAAPAYGWELSVNALTFVRIRATAYTSGTQNWVLELGSYATEPIPAVQTHAVTMTSTTIAASATATGMSVTRLLNVNATDQSIKASSGRVYSLYAYNPGAADAFVHLYNATTASTTPGTTTPFASYLVPAGGTVDMQFNPIPLSMGTAITIAATTTLAGGTNPDTDLMAQIGWL